jgi:hypothetical protein
MTAIMAAALCLRHFQSGKILDFCCSVYITISVPCKPLSIVTAIKTKGKEWACRTHVKEKYKHNILSEESNAMDHLEKTEPLLTGYQKHPLEIREDAHLIHPFQDMDPWCVL